MGRKTQWKLAPFYVRGLLGPGERKDLQPIAARLGLSGHDQSQLFVASPAWDDSPLWTVLAHEADQLLGEAGEGSAHLGAWNVSGGGRAHTS